MTTVFHAWPYGRFIEIRTSLRRKTLYRTNQGSNFLGGSFNNRDNVRAPIKFRKESQSQNLTRWFFLKNSPTIFLSIAPVLLEWSKKTSWVFPALKSTSHLLPNNSLIRKSKLLWNFELMLNLAYQNSVFTIK